MNIPRVASSVLLAVGLLCPAGRLAAQGTIVDHTCTDLDQIPASAIAQAKAQLHIAYGHTSHGSQLVTGMNGLATFMAAKDDDAFPDGLFAYDGAFLHDYAFDSYGGYDLGNPDRTTWASATRAYLADHPGTNVVIWSWCGQAGTATAAEIATYLALMSGLEADFPGVTFVHMTGHLDGSGASGNLNLRNQQIRDHCTANNKVLFDFADIESHDPDWASNGINYMALSADDNCDYDSDGNGSRDGNWATAWQNAHVEGVDWYACSPAHSQALNGNLKAYAAWWLWARLAGWTGPNPDTTAPSVPTDLAGAAASTTSIALTWTAATDDVGVVGYRVYRNGTLAGTPAAPGFTDTGLTPGSTCSYAVAAVDAAGNASAPCAAVAVSTPAVDLAAPSVPTGLAAGDVTTTTLALSWDASTDDVAVTAYDVYRNGTLVGSPAAPGFTDTGLAASTTYFYQVAARDAAGNVSALCAAVFATTATPAAMEHTVTITGTANVSDTFLFASAPSSNYGSTQYMSTTERFLVRFTLPAAVSGRRIVDAQLSFYVWAQTNWQSGQYLDLYRVTRVWSESQATWNLASTDAAWATAGAAGVPADHAELVGRILQTEGGDHVFYPAADVTSVVQKWAAGTVDNLGLLLVNDSLTGIGLKASEYSTTDCPTLVVTYTDEAAPVTYAMWVHSQFTDAQLADAALEATVWGSGADPDGDGTINLLEYALATDPDNAAAGAASALDCEPSTDGAAPRLVFRRTKGLEGVAFGLEHSTDLDAWTAVASGLTQTVADNGDGTETVVWLPTPDSGTARGFYRLVLSVAP